MRKYLHLNENETVLFSALQPRNSYMWEVAKHNSCFDWSQHRGSKE